MMRFLSILLVCCLGFVIGKQPNIVFFLADDTGWNDVGWNNPSVLTPNMNRLAYDGVILDQNYVHPVCTPSRTALMSGKYPHRLGLQNLVIQLQEPACLPTGTTLLPQKLKELGYSTHMVGKWHLGFCKWECTPTYRGFDTFYGFYDGNQNYYNHSSYCSNGSCSALDFRRNEEPAFDVEGIYTTELYSAEVEDIIARQDKDKPMFLYYASQSTHSQNPQLGVGPQNLNIDVPKEYEDLYSYVQNNVRRKYMGMVTAMDDMIGSLVDSLKRHDMFEDTIIIFVSDNGGQAIDDTGNNWPLRGAKATVFEGGTRSPSFVYWSGLQQAGVTLDSLVHITDWFPTIISAAGGQTDEDSDLDGVDQWDTIVSGAEAKRTEFIYHLDDSHLPVQGEAAIRVGDWKLIRGFPGGAGLNNWFPPPENQLTANMNVSTAGDINGYWLFNLRDDPSETTNLALDYPVLLSLLEASLDEYAEDMVPVINQPIDWVNSHPDKFDGVWSPGWC